MAWTGCARLSRAVILLSVAVLVSIACINGTFESGELGTPVYQLWAQGSGGGTGAGVAVFQPLLGLSGGGGGGAIGGGGAAGASGAAAGGAAGPLPGSAPGPQPAGCREGFDGVDGECLFACHTDLPIRQVSKAGQKGICLDDTTLLECSDRIPYMWPQTQERVTSIRIFSPWKPAWPAEKRDAAWAGLLKFVKTNRAMVLVGVEHTCDDSLNDREWEVAKQFLTMLGPHHVMGVSIGNEMELLHLKSKEYTSDACQERLWKRRAFWKTFVARIQDLDRLPGFNRVTVTSVMGSFALVGSRIGNSKKRTPFIEKQYAMLNTFLQDATRMFGKRYAFAFNFYPYFDPSFKPDAATGGQTCWDLLHSVNCLGPNCMVANQARSARLKAQQITGRPDDTLWIGETGWSHPISSTMKTAMKTCTEWHSRRTFKMYYERFLNWDLSVERIRPPDHVFYFTMRDSVNFGMSEHFGLIPSCESRSCKLQAAPGCRTVKESDPCHAHVKWAKDEGIHQHPEWYPGLRPSSTMDDFQEHLHRNGLGDCPEPC